MSLGRVTKTVADYNLYRILGQGAYGKVYLGLKDGDETQYALKEIEKAKIEQKKMTVAVEREIEVMKGLKQRNIVQLLDVIHTDTHLYMVLELAEGGELFDKIVNSETGTFDEDTARFYFHQLVDGVEYCHKKGVAHRDLKLENILLDSKGVLKITDFGFSTYFLSYDSGNQSEKLLKSLVGTLCYLAPEVLGGQGYSGTKADIWSIGVVLYVMLCGQYPFNAQNHMMKMKQIKEADYTCPDWISTDAQMLIGRLMEPDADERITIEEIRKDVWFNEEITHVQDLDIDVTQLQVEYFVDDDAFDDDDSSYDDDDDDYDEINDEIDDELSEDQTLFGGDGPVKVVNLDEVRAEALQKYASDASTMSTGSMASVIHNPDAASKQEEGEGDELTVQVNKDGDESSDMKTDEKASSADADSDKPLTAFLVSKPKKKKTKKASSLDDSLDMSALDAALETTMEDSELPEFNANVSRRTRFVSRYTAHSLLTKLEEVFEANNVSVKINWKTWSMEGEMKDTGATFMVQIYKLSTGLRMVEFQRLIGDIIGFQTFYKETRENLFGAGLGAYQSVGAVQEIKSKLQVKRQSSWS